jgi:hypothetical protein
LVWADDETAALEGESCLFLSVCRQNTDYRHRFRLAAEKAYIALQHRVSLSLVLALQQTLWEVNLMPDEGDDERYVDLSDHCAVRIDSARLKMLEGLIRSRCDENLPGASLYGSLWMILPPDESLPLVLRALHHSMSQHFQSSFSIPAEVLFRLPFSPPEDSGISLIDEKKPQVVQRDIE